MVWNRFFPCRISGSRLEKGTEPALPWTGSKTDLEPMSTPHWKVTTWVTWSTRGEYWPWNWWHGDVLSTTKSLVQLRWTTTCARTCGCLWAFTCTFTLMHRHVMVLGSGCVWNSFNIKSYLTKPHSRTWACSPRVRSSYKNKVRISIPNDIVIGATCHIIHNIILYDIFFECYTVLFVVFSTIMAREGLQAWDLGLLHNEPPTFEKDTNLFFSLHLWEKYFYVIIWAPN